jgi:biopolymer transport protein ExbB
LCAHREESKALREEVAEVWLNDQRSKLTSGIRLLQVMALLTPLLGLLGTVLGLINVFERLAVHSGPIEPSLLADGLGMAMYTTAIGLVIALPALAGAHGFQIWIDKIIYRAEYMMNDMNLLFDGVDMRKRHD